MEDDPALLDLMKAFVRDALASGPAREVVGVESSSHAAYLMGQRPPDLVVLDLRLPDLHGKTLLHAIRGTPELADVPVIVHTGVLDVSVESLNVFAVFHKPARMSEVKAAVQTALGIVDEGPPPLAAGPGAPRGPAPTG